MNSLWGEISQRNMPQQKTIEASEWHKLWKLHEAGEIEIKDYEEAGLGRQMLTHWIDFRQRHNNSYKTNVAAGSYVTAHDRLMLLEKM